MSEQLTEEELLNDLDSVINDFRHYSFYKVRRIASDLRDHLYKLCREWDER